MVDRIDKLKPNESWKIQETSSSKKDKRDSSEEEKQQNAKSSFEEQPDWKHLIAKDGPGGNLLTRDLKKISFKHSNPSLENEATDLHHVDIEAEPAKNKFSAPKNKVEFSLLIFAVALLLVLIYLIGRLFI